jgi:methionyl-tRNA formyltransferase
VPASAVVFAYHDVGVRCLQVLLAQGIDVRLVVTHEDNPSERIWFGSVAETAGRYGLDVATPDAPNDAAFVARLESIAPEFLFSFYYRHMLSPRVLATAKRGAYNMHGSLLPRYRGRVPVNWAIIHGERETGASLHEMVEKPDAGRLVDQLAVPILPNDFAVDVFRKVTVAAEAVLARALPALVEGTARPIVQDLSRGSYFGGRKPDDGRIDWSRDAWTVHNLVRAVAPPYPGAFSRLGDAELRVLGTFWRGERIVTAEAAPARPTLYSDGRSLRLRCADGGLLEVLDATLAGEPLSPQTLQARFGPAPVPLPL